MDRYTTNHALIQVRCGCGHFDLVEVPPGHFIVIDGTYEKCVTCQALPEPEEGRDPGQPEPGDDGPSEGKAPNQVQRSGGLA